jgi:hypothetical protein
VSSALRTAGFDPRHRDGQLNPAPAVAALPGWAVGRNWAGVGLGSIFWRAYAHSLIPMDPNPVLCEHLEPEVSAERMFGCHQRSYRMGSGRL